jgi:hypothetical protein
MALIGTRRILTRPEARVFVWMVTLDGICIYAEIQKKNPVRISAVKW